MYRRLLVHATALLPCVFVGTASAQNHSSTDSSLSGSLLLITPLASLHAHTAGTASANPRITRVEVQYVPALRAGTLSQMMVGVRSDWRDRDTTEWTPLIAGARAAFVGNRAGAGGAALSSLEVSVGGRSLGHQANPSRPNLGLDFVAGLNRIETNIRGSLAVRFPVEFIRQRPAGSLAFAVVPALGWGHLRVRDCHDRGPGDGCGDLGLQLAAGVTRFVLGGSITAGLSSGLSAVAGVQHLFAPGEKPRLSAGLAFGR